MLSIPWGTTRTAGRHATNATFHAGELPAQSWWTTPSWHWTYPKHPSQWQRRQRTVQCSWSWTERRISAASCQGNRETWTSAGRSWWLSGPVGRLQEWAATPGGETKNVSPLAPSQNHPHPQNNATFQDVSNSQRFNVNFSCSNLQPQRGMWCMSWKKSSPLHSLSSL